MKINVHNHIVVSHVSLDNGNFEYGTSAADHHSLGGWETKLAQSISLRITRAHDLECRRTT